LTSYQGAAARSHGHSCSVSPGLFPCIDFTKACRLQPSARIITWYAYYCCRCIVGSIANSIVEQARSLQIKKAGRICAHWYACGRGVAGMFRSVAFREVGQHDRYLLFEEGNSNTACFLFPPLQGEIKPPAMRVVVDLIFK